VTVPSADDLFRPTEEETDAGAAPAPRTKRSPVHAVPDQRPAIASGRIRHDEKMTVYVTSDELLDIEHARLALRSVHGLVVDRGRLVREAIALVLADLDKNAADSALVRRLLEE
jgi:hypothetical protein